MLALLQCRSRQVAARGTGLAPLSACNHCRPPAVTCPEGGPDCQLVPRAGTPCQRHLPGPRPPRGRSRGGLSCCTGPSAAAPAAERRHFPATPTAVPHPPSAQPPCLCIRQQQPGRPTLPRLSWWDSMEALRAAKSRPRCRHILCSGSRGRSRQERRSECLLRVHVLD